jgi:hypothetical protein
LENHDLYLEAISTRFEEFIQSPHSSVAACGLLVERQEPPLIIHRRFVDPIVQPKTSTFKVHFQASKTHGNLKATNLV